MNIGVLEDNPAIRDLLQTALEMVGHSVSTYVQGQALLDAVFKEHNTERDLLLALPYDLLIIDLNLPGELCGLDVITSIYRQLTPDRLPIIVVSAGSLSELDQLHRHFPSLSVLRKPFVIRTLLEMISLRASFCSLGP